MTELLAYLTENCCGRGEACVPACDPADALQKERAMKRLHVHVSVDDLAQSTRFYSTSFAAEPTVVKGCSTIRGSISRSVRGPAARRDLASRHPGRGCSTTGS